MEATAAGEVDQYFGALPREKVVAALEALERETWEVLERRRAPMVWREIAAQVFGLRNDGSAQTGLEYADAEKTSLLFRINLTKPMIEQQIIMVMGQRRVSYKARAINSDFTALSSVNIAQKALEYVVNDSGLDQIGYKALGYDRYFGRGCIWVRWDYKAGEMVDGMVPLKDERGEPVTRPAEPAVVDPQTGAEVQPARPAEPVKVKGKVRSGAPTYRALPPWQCLSDTILEDSPWCIIKEPVSKWELAAQFSEHRAAILAGSGLDRRLGDMELLGWNVQASPKDITILRHFLHRDSEAVPGGRWVGYCNGKLLWDVPCPVSEGLPIVEISTAQYIGTQIGFPQVTDLLSLQDAFTEVASQVITNVQRFGNQNMYVPQGSEYDREAIARGGAFLEVPKDSTPPRAIEMAAMSPAAKYILDLCPQLMTEISGQNSVSRGQPSSNITSGVFAALMLNIAEKMQSPTQIIYDRAVSRLGNLSLELIRNNAENGFLADVSGKQNQPYLRHFTTDKLSSVHNVQVVRQDPIVETFPARMEVVQAVVKLPKDIQKQSMEMLLTGNLDALTEDNHSQSILINWENEQLMQGNMGEPQPAVGPDGQPLIDPTTGQPVMLPPNGLDPMITDDPKLHCLSHRTSLDRLRVQPKPPEGTPAREQYENAIKAHVLHLAKHGGVWKGADPVMTQIVGIPMPPGMLPNGQPANNALPGADQDVDGEESGAGAPPKLGQEAGPKPKLPEPAKPPAQLNQQGSFASKEV